MKKDNGLAVAYTRLKSFDLRINVAVHVKEVHPTIVVRVKKAASPPQVVRMKAEPHRQSDFLKEPGAIVPVEIG